MKTKLFLTALGAILTVPTFAAVQKCVPLTPEITCADPVFQTSSYDWSVTCNRLPIQGIAVAADNGDDDVADSVSSANGITECWCKIVSPVVTKWAWASHVVTGHQSCSYACAISMVNESEFRSFILASFSD